MLKSIPSFVWIVNYQSSSASLPRGWERCRSIIITACLTEALSFVVSCVMWERNQDKIDSREIVKRHHSQVKFYWIQSRAVTGDVLTVQWDDIQEIVDLACIIRWDTCVKHSSAKLPSTLALSKIPDWGRLEVNFYRSCTKKIHNSPIIPFFENILFVTIFMPKRHGLFTIFLGRDHGDSCAGRWEMWWARMGGVII